MKTDLEPTGNSTIVVVADSGFVLPVFILVLSLRYHQVNAKVRILSLGLTLEEKGFFTQFDQVYVHESEMRFTTNAIKNRAIANLCKREAVFLAKEDKGENIALLDGDSIVTGDITKHINPATAALYVRTRSASEDNLIFKSRYKRNDKPGSIPRRVLNVWKKDNFSNNDPAIDHTSLSGNLVVHREFLPFMDEWGDLMEKVLPHSQLDFDHVAYEIMGDYSLSSVLAFGKHKPPIHAPLTDKSTGARIAHLGPAPKYWKMWPAGKLRYLGSVLSLLDWADEQEFRIPTRSWTLKRRYVPFIYLTAYVYLLILAMKTMLRFLYRLANPRFRDRVGKY